MGVPVLSGQIRTPVPANHFSRYISHVPIGTYEIRVGYHYLGQTPGLDVTALWGIVL